MDTQITSETVIVDDKKADNVSDKILFLDSTTNLYIENGKPFLNGKEYTRPQEKNEDPLPEDIDILSLADSYKRQKYVELLKKGYENLLILSGAGSSVASGGKTVAKLWDVVNETLGKEKFSSLAKKVKFIKSNINFDPATHFPKDLELLLSKAVIAKEFLVEDAELDKDITAIEKIIRDECSLSLNENSVHEQFLSKITSRKLKDPRVKIFNLNYDTLFEQAAILRNFTVIDGFSFSHPRTLSGRNFDIDVVYREKTRIKEEESYLPNVFHLYKIHGSLDWVLKNGKVIIGTFKPLQENDTSEEPLIIYPKSSKYESSYEHPYFEMMARFQQNLRQNNVLLITIGFSFYDKHISSAIKEAVLQNPSFKLLVIDYEIKKGRNPHLDWLILNRTKNNNVTLVSETFEDFTKNYPFSPIYSEAYNFTNNVIENDK